MKIFVLKTKLFSENGIIEQAIADLASSHEVSHLDAKRSDLTDQDWDKALRQIMDVDRVLTL
jgi:hypothetical protein